MTPGWAARAGGLDTESRAVEAWPHPPFARPPAVLPPRRRQSREIQRHACPGSGTRWKHSSRAVQRAPATNKTKASGTPSETFGVSAQVSPRVTQVARHLKREMENAVGRSLRPLPHDLQRQAGKRAGIRELHFVSGDGRNDPALIGSSNKIWKRCSSRYSRGSSLCLRPPYTCPCRGMILPRRWP